MTVDLSTLKEGDKVRLRGETEFHIMAIKLKNSSETYFPYKIYYSTNDGYHGIESYQETGHCISPLDKHPFDIVEINPDKKEPVKNVFYTKENESIKDLVDHLEKHETNMVYNTSKKYKVTIEEI